MTKLVPVAAIALAVTAAASVVTVGAAFAENALGLNRARSTASTLALSNVQADQAGVVRILRQDGRSATRLPVEPAIDARAAGAGDQPARSRLLVKANASHAVARMGVRDAPTD